jgi:pre-mRNA-splicing factor RBM22/SLT11
LVFDISTTFWFTSLVGLPVQVRDSALPASVQPTSDVNREWFADQAERQLASGQLTYGKAEMRHLLEKVARNAPYYQRNKPHVCSFFLKGECNRGDSCPYR